MQKSACIAKISTWSQGGTFCVHPVLHQRCNEW